MKMNICPFCGLEEREVAIVQLDSPTRFGIDILFKGEQLVILPDVAPVTLFHLLIIPFQHIYSINHLQGKALEELQVLKNKVKVFHQRQFNKNTLFFEHGSCHIQNGSSCIAHAHLHAIPFSSDEFRQIYPSILSKLKNPVPRQEEDYLYLEFDSIERYWIDKKESQFFRGVIAEFEGTNRKLWQSCLYAEELKTTNDLTQQCLTAWRFSEL